MDSDWTLDDVERLLRKLDEQRVLAVVEDVFWVLEKIKSPETSEYRYFRDLIAA